MRAGPNGVSCLAPSPSYPVSGGGDALKLCRGERGQRQIQGNDGLPTGIGVTYGPAWPELLIEFYIQFCDSQTDGFPES